jgi:hypothetical protein
MINRLFLFESHAREQSGIYHDILSIYLFFNARRLGPISAQRKRFNRKEILDVYFNSRLIWVLCPILLHIKNIVK